ncbi:hypothetical protein HU200_017313 [Digitaria exilis]|uniref:peptidylprolyl isomerase n=1 Tax=Digitaria exilis TaxID=1010633 RepID=A0A835KK21_9POAL|nr:hypothetical protein HU200_017313 [Digitaria exilis]
MGFEKQILRAGTGPKPRKGQKVTVHCTGYGSSHKPLIYNDVLGSAYLEGLVSYASRSITKDPGQQPFTFSIGQGSVIKGWDEGVMTMQVGEVARIQCTPDYAYGASGFPAWGIQPDSVLAFEIEVLSAQ